MLEEIPRIPVPVVRIGTAPNNMQRGSGSTVLPKNIEKKQTTILYRFNWLLHYTNNLVTVLYTEGYLIVTQVLSKVLNAV